MYTLSIKLKSPEKAARESAIYPQPQTNDTAHHELGFPSYFLCQNLQNLKKQRRISLLLGRVGKKNPVWTTHNQP